MWIINAIIVHILLFGSIFVIYFRSPVISGLQAQEPLSAFKLEPPAKRLVLIVTDGLRAESFFQRNCSDVPYIRDLLLQQGLVGISHTRVPTESRPGHIALIAGLYEDPSAVTRGWKENPIDFDTLFNRSSHTYAFGAHDVLHIFSRICGEQLFIDAYDHELDFSGQNKTYQLDEWVFEHVRLLLRRKGDQLRGEQQVIYFLHLLGLDSAGHIHKPGSELFLENLHRTDHGIWNIYEEFERTFPDGRTTYLLTSDHGMTDAGSHGSGDPLETDTPFFLWGAGILHKVAPHLGRTFSAGAHGTLPLHELEQAQLTPLMSTLLGLPPPMNNFGTLPLGLLNVSAKYEAIAAHNNALQLLEQYHRLLHEHQLGFLAAHLRHFRELNTETVLHYKHTMSEHLKSGNYDTALQSSSTIMCKALEGIEYYHGYYRNVLLAATAAAFLGWIFYMLQLLVADGSIKPKATWGLFRVVCLCVIFIIVVLFCVLQRVPSSVACYLILPIVTWTLAFQRHPVSFFIKHQHLVLKDFVFLVFCAELLVITFFERRMISLVFLFFVFVTNSNFFTSRGLKFYIWLILVVVLAIAPLLPPSVGYKNTPLLIVGMLCTVGRAHLVKSHLSSKVKLSSAICLGNEMLCIYQNTNQVGVSLISHMISWSYLFYAIISIVIYPSPMLKYRIELIFFNLSSLYATLCTSYELLFIFILGSELVLSFSAQLANSAQLNYSATLTKKFSYQLKMSFRLAFAILLYTFFSFFGTGNIASISSFDPNIVRCFLTTFSPFIIMALVILKLIIPVILNISIIFSLSPLVRAHERQVFICLLLICDIMGMNFLFLVRNHGSWLQIGSSISHFVIMEATTVVLLLLTGVAKVFLGLRVDTATTLKAK